MKNISIILIALFTFSTADMFAGNEDRVGSAGGTQLLINPWARSTGLAGANIANVEGIMGSFLNPAGIAFTRKSEIMFTNTTWLSGADISINAIGLSQRLGESSVIGISVVSIDWGELARSTTALPEGDGTTFSPNFSNLALSFAKEFSNSIYGGMSLKIVSEGIADINASGFALDAGIKYVSGERDQVKFGIALKNVGPGMKYSGTGLTEGVTTGNGSSLNVEQRSASFELPSLVNIGVGYDFVLAEDHDLTGMVSFTSNSFSKDQYKVGLEYSFKEYFNLRGGYSLEPESKLIDEDTNALSGPAFGASLALPIGDEGGSLGFDYSYQVTNPFDGVHSIGLRLDL
ncbi:MAG: PorV/PorQ family protein [Flavobacteriales bacterium]|nr:PorV/PorQ family protein [Flavobacteriales bacterium]